MAIGRGSDGSIQVLVDANEPALLAVQVLKYQREVHGLSLADIAKLLGASSRNAYATTSRGAPSRRSASTASCCAPLRRRWR